MRFPLPFALFLSSSAVCAPARGARGRRPRDSVALSGRAEKKTRPDDGTPVVSVGASGSHLARSPPVQCLPALCLSVDPQWKPERPEFPPPQRAAPSGAKRLISSTITRTLSVMKERAGAASGARPLPRPSTAGATIEDKPQ